MTIEQRLYQLLSGSVPQLFPIQPPASTVPPYTVYTIVSQDPWETHQGGTVTGLRKWCIQFSSYGENYSQINALTETILGILLPFSDSGVRACFLRDRHTGMDTRVKLPESMVEFEIIEALG